MRPQRQEILVKVRLGSCIHTLKYFFFNVKIHNLKWKLKSKGWLRRRARAKRWKDSSWLDDEEAREEFWLDAWRVWGCRRPAGAEGRVESSFGPSPRENVSHCQRGKMEEREWRWKWEVREKKRKNRETREEEKDTDRREGWKERCSLSAREHEVGWWKIRGDNKLLWWSCCVLNVGTRRYAVSLKELWKHITEQT